MAAAGPAAGPSTSKQDLIDLYGDLNQNEEDLDRIAEANELFDAVLTGSVDRDKKVTTDVAPPKTTAATEEVNSKVVNNKGRNSLRKLSLYIGNFPWWTSDKDIICMAQTLGVRDIIEIKFAENKVNGQSRGFAEVVVTSDESFKLLLEKIPKCEINGERVDCRFATRQNLSVFEDMANKRIPLRVNSKDSKDTDPSNKIPSLLSQESSPPPIPPLLPSHPLANRFPSLPNPYLSHPPPPFPHMPPNIPPPMPPHLYPPHPVHIPSQPPPSLHINPAFFNPAQDGHSSKAYSQQKHTPQRTDGDFEELLNRNKAVASSAISKAVSGATAGDLRVAMETLLTAIAIIKQSRVYGDERCQALVTSLKDCLVSIQGNYGYRSGSRSGDDERDRDRGRDRERERERDRDRDREDSSGWDGVGMSRRHIDHSRSRDRDKARSRERHRDQRDQRDQRDHRDHRDHRDRYR
ncbi:cleavage and polyadenylation specificity factor subunit 7-like [Epinephelus lanceolatus]|uniref:cleavage and polyadenylation specificity factor subunit 7-like n=1 Tax=Epinephelus moara TaxID=300413 RepID=UPI00214EED2D|nr:cleavage and polyadenylation specificity factor subunit 7-like [Epinephelus moara]